MSWYSHRVTSSRSSDGTPRPEELGAILGRLAAAGTPWVAITPHTRLPDKRDATVIDVTDMRRPPLAVNPFEPEPGCPVQSHIDRLAALVEAAFRPPGPARAALRLGLRRAYADCGWDITAGAALPGAKAPPGVPSIGGLCRAVLREATGLGVDPGQRATIRGFLDVRLRALWTGPAGQFLGVGHPADLGGLTRRNVLFTAGDIVDEQAAAFLAGVLLIRFAEQLRVRQLTPASVAEGRHAAQAPHTAGAPGAVVLAVPDGGLRRLLDEIRGYGASVIAAECTPPECTPPAGSVAGGEHAAADGSASVALRGRRSAACGLQCRRRPCSGYELHAAELLAGAEGQVWLRLWGQALVLAFLTGRPLPHVPTALRRTWPSFDVRTRECLLAAVVRAAVASRAVALRHTYDPRRLEAAVATTAAGLLAAAVPSAATVVPSEAAPAPAAAEANGVVGATSPVAGDGWRDDSLPGPIPARAGPVWVIPQLRWLHEVDRLNPLGPRQVGRADIAPPLDFELAGLADWPGIRVGDRLDRLRRHRLCMDYEPNRDIASTALLGADHDDHDDRAGPGRTTFEADLAIAGIGLDPMRRLRHTERMLGIIRRGTEPGWLEVVLSWPTRLIRPGP